MTERQKGRSKNGSSTSLITNLPELKAKQLRSSKTKSSLTNIAKIRKIVLPRKREVLKIDNDSDEDDYINETKKV